MEQPPLGLNSRPQWRSHGCGFSKTDRSLWYAPGEADGNLPSRESCSRGHVSLEVLHYQTAVGAWGEAAGHRAVLGPGPHERQGGEKATLFRSLPREELPTLCPAARREPMPNAGAGCSKLRHARLFLILSSLHFTFMGPLLLFVQGF